jgi:hypothetical protein
MLPTLFEISPSGTEWILRSPFRTSEYRSKAEAIEAALRAARFKDGVSLRILGGDGLVESELKLNLNAQPQKRSAPRPVREIDRRTARNIRFYADKPADLLERRLRELTSEVPLEAIVYGGGTLLTLISLIFVLFGRKKFSIVALMVSVLQFQFFYEKRNPLIHFLRVRGYRSEREIKAEKYSLEALRGDFSIFNETDEPIERARKCLSLFS